MADGIDNLLYRCVKIKLAQKLLLVGEAGENTYFDSDLCMAVKRAADRLGVTTVVHYIELFADAPKLPEFIAKEMLSSDAVISFSRFGDQIRFTLSPGQGKTVMSYTIPKAHLQVSFATIDHEKMTQMLNLLEARIRAASCYRIETRDGTGLVGKISSGEDRKPSKDFCVDLFPVMIIEPIN